MARTLEQIEQEIERLKNEKKDFIARQRAEEAKMRELACNKIGSYVVSLFDNGWRSIDYETLAETLAAAIGETGNLEAREFDAAAKALKTFNPRRIKRNIEKPLSDKGLLASDSRPPASNVFDSPTDSEA